MDSLLPFAGLAALIVVTPGPDLMLVTRSVLAGGRRAGVLTSLGIASGSAAWALAAAAGLATLLGASPDLLALVRWLGAGYLAWIGIRALSTRVAPMTPTPGDIQLAHRGRMEPFRTGLISNLLHPGQIIFYTSMMPQFIDPAGEPALEALALGAVFVGILLAWFSTFAVLASKLKPLRWERLAPALTRVTGIVLIGFAVRLVARL